MEQNKAIQILVNAVELAQKRGAYSLSEAEQIINAIKVFTYPEKKEEEVKVETNVEEVKE